MATIVTRSGKGSALTHAEGDANFTNLNTDKIEEDDVRTLTNKTIVVADNTITTAASGNLAATELNAALAELDTDKVPESDFSAFGKTLVDDATAKAAKDTLQIQVDGLTGLRGLTPVDGEVVYIKYHTTQSDGGHGEFEGLTGAVLGTYVDDNGVTILPTGGDGSSCWRRRLDGFVTPEMFGAVGDGVTTDTTAVNAAFTYARSIASANQNELGVVAFSPAAKYLVDSTIDGGFVSIIGNNATLYATTDITILNLYGTKCTWADFRAWHDSSKSAATAIAIELGDSVVQTSKNNLININTRNSYRGMIIDPASANCWGNVFINVRCDNHYDWQWYLDSASGTTTNTFINCHAKGSLGVGTPKGAYLSNIADVVLINFAADQTQADYALRIAGAQSVSADVINFESCEMTTNLAALCRISAEDVSIDRLVSRVGLYDFGVGNKGYLLQLDSTTVTARVGRVVNLQDQAGATGTLYAIRNSTGTRLQAMQNDLDTIDTSSGGVNRVYNLGDVKGYSNSFAGLPASSGAREVYVNQTPNAGEASEWVDDGTDRHISGVIYGGQRITATTAQLEDVTDVVNTKGKWAGKSIFNTTTNKVVVAIGATAGSEWANSGTGVTEHTPA